MAHRPGRGPGRGQHGHEVYRGRHEQWGELAVKVMHKAHVPEHRACREQELLLKLADEAGAGSSNVIKYRCRVDTADTVMLGMELCECSLHSCCCATARCALAAVLLLAARLLLCYCSLHA